MSTVDRICAILVVFGVGLIAFLVTQQVSAQPAPARTGWKDIGGGLKAKTLHDGSAIVVRQHSHGGPCFVPSSAWTGGR